MFSTKINILMTTVVIAIILSCSTRAKEQSEDGSDKDPRCHQPKDNDICSVSVLELRNWEVSGYFYNSEVKSCHAVFSDISKPICPENQDLPKTREECENLCGDSCLMSNGMTGICMYDEHCEVFNEVPGADPRPCGTYYANCCPKLSDTTLPSTYHEGDFYNEIIKNVSTGNSFGTYYIYHL